MNGNSFEGAHLPDDVLLRAADAGDADADRPHAGDFIEVSGGAGGVGDRAFASELVQTPSLAMAFVAEACRRSGRHRSERAAGSFRE